MTPGEIRQLRLDLGLSQQRFATRYHVAVATLQSWEQGRRHPEATSSVFLQLIRLAPQTIATMLEIVR